MACTSSPMTKTRGSLRISSRTACMAARAYVIWAMTYASGEYVFEEGGWIGDRTAGRECDGGIHFSPDCRAHLLEFLMRQISCVMQKRSESLDRIACAPRVDLRLGAIGREGHFRMLA